MQTFNEMKRKNDCINCLETAGNHFWFYNLKTLLNDKVHMFVISNNIWDSEKGELCIRMAIIPKATIVFSNPLIFKPKAESLHFNHTLMIWFKIH